MSDTRLKAKLNLHAELARLMADNRFDDGRRDGADLRLFCAAYLWSKFDYAGDKEASWQWVKDRAGLTSHRFGVQHTHYRLRALYASDAPRYEPFERGHWGCDVTVTRGPRTGERCGKTGGTSFRVTDPKTGQWHMQSWCASHRALAETRHRHERMILADGVPEPHPNVGGLLPCYIRASNWPEIYTSAAVRWKPPTAGICADDWHTPASSAAVTAVEQRRSFAVVAGGREQTATEPPSLRLVR